MIDRRVDVASRFVFTTNLDDRDLLQFVHAWLEATRDEMLRAWRGAATEGDTRTLEYRGMVGPTIPPSMRLHVRDDDDLHDRRTVNDVDSMVDEIEYLQQRDEDARAAWEVEQARRPDWDPIDDPLHGETTARYEEGNMP